MSAFPPLLETKLYPAIGAEEPLVRDALALPPGLKDGLISLVNVTAPAGYGKSTLMAQWRYALDECGVRSGWLNLDEDDNDLSRFGRYLAGALVNGGLDAESFSLQRVQDTGFVRGAQSVLEALAADLNTQQQRLVLFIDDVHVIHSPDVIEILRWLVNYSPPQLQFVLGSRAEVPLPLGRLRVRRKLLEFGVDALKFNVEEAAQLMSSRLRVALQPVDIDRLVQRTEGWPAGLELAGLILEGAGNPSEVISAFAGNDQGVMDYLGEVLLDNLDADTREKIFHIAQFNRIDAALMAAATESDRASSRAELEQLHARNLFLKRMDAEGRWYRFHHLVGQFFREQGERHMPEQVRATLIRGSDHLLAQGLRQEALHGVFRAQDWDRASRWLSEHIEDLIFQRGHVQTTLEWSRLLPAEYANRHPAILLHTAFALMLSGQENKARGMLDRLEMLREQMAAQPDTDPVKLAHLECALGMHEAHLAGLKDDMDEALRISEDWMRRWPDAPEAHRASVANVLAFAYKCHGDIDRGLAVNAEGKSLAQKHGAHYVMSWNLTIESYLHIKRGDLAAAEDAARRQLRYMDEHLSLMHQHAGHGHAVLAFVHYERDEIDQAREHIECISENERNPQADYLILHYLTRSRLLALDGDGEAAIQCLSRGQERAEGFGLSRVGITLLTERLNLLCSLGRMDEVRELAQRLQLHLWPDNDDSFTLRGDKAARICTRLYMEEDPVGVAARCAALLEHSEQRQLHHRQVEWLLQEAQAWQYAGESERAADCLRRALVIGAEQGYLRVFHDHCDLLRPTLRSLVIDPAEAGAVQLLKRIVDVRSRAPVPTASPDQSGLVEELTKRELQILTRLRSDLSNREIAEAIFVSEGTLKWHLHNIYGKLGVKNRSGALLRAAEMHLI